MAFDRLLKGEGPLRKFLEERMKRGPVLKKLRDQFFRSATKICDVTRFNANLLDDIKVAKGLVAIISPFLNRSRVEWFINTREVKDAINRDLRVVVITRPPTPDEVEDVKEHKNCIDMLEKVGVKVVTESKLHFKAVIIDNETIYLGSINPLSVLTVKYIPPDYMVRFESEALIDEIIENTIGRELYEKWIFR